MNVIRMNVITFILSGLSNAGHLVGICRQMPHPFQEICESVDYKAVMIWLGTCLGCWIISFPAELSGSRGVTNVMFDSVQLFFIYF